MRNLITSSSSWSDPIDIFIPFIDHAILEQISKVLYTGELFSDDLEMLKKVQLVLTEFLGFPTTNFEISGQGIYSLAENNDGNKNFVEEESDYQMAYLQWLGSDKCNNHQTDEILTKTQVDHDLENHALNDHSNHNHNDGCNVVNIPPIVKNYNNNPEISTTNMEILKNIEDSLKGDTVIAAREFDGSIKNVHAFNFELISEGFLEMPENLPAHELKMPNIDDAFVDLPHQVFTNFVNLISRKKSNLDNN